MIAHRSRLCESVGRDNMSNVFFEDRAIAFIDVLGFSDIVNNASKNAIVMSQLQSLVELLSSAVPTLNNTVENSVPHHLIPTHTYISDSIILSAPLFDRTVSNYNGLEILVMRCIQLTHHFLNSGYLLRGAIAVGKVWHEESNVVGPAYQEAYKLEKIGCEPRIVLSKNSAAQWEKGYGSGSRMCIQKDGVTMVNGLLDFYIPGNTEYGVIEAIYDKYDKLTEKAINSSLPPEAIKKWLWFKEYLKAEGSEGRKWSVA